MSDTDLNRPYGLPIKPGHDVVSPSDWSAMCDFIAGRSWWFDTPCSESDIADSLIAPKPAYGAFALGFDFHLTPEGPRLIEINTNAGGFASAIAMAEGEFAGALLEDRFVSALRDEYAAAGHSGRPRFVAIVDDNPLEQVFYPEMRFFADILERHEIPAVVISPQEIENASDGLRFGGRRIDFIYNRLTDFRLTEPSHAMLREAAIAGIVVLSPHPGVYARVADKRNLIRLKHPINPEAMFLSARSQEAWIADRKHWVFKPPVGAASKGVYRGDKLTLQKLATLTPDTVVQRMVPPPLAADGTKYDVRIFTHGSQIMAAFARHYGGQVMEMRSELAGLRRIRVE